MGNKIKKTKKQEIFTLQALTCNFTEIPEFYSPLIFRSKIDCIYFKKNREYMICDRKGEYVNWLDDETGRKNLTEEYLDLVENKGEDMRSTFDQKSTCCEMGNIYIKYSKSNTVYGPENNGWSFDRDQSAVNINYCPFCGKKLIT